MVASIRTSSILTKERALISYFLDGHNSLLKGLNFPFRNRKCDNDYWRDWGGTFLLLKVLKGKKIGYVRKKKLVMAMMLTG